MRVLKIIARIALILAAALLVVGATLALSQTSLGAQLLSTRGGPEGGLRNAAADAGQPPANFASQAGFPSADFALSKSAAGDFDRAGGGSGLVLNLARHLGTIGAIVLVYVAISLSFFRLKGWLKRRRSTVRSAAF